MIGKLKNGGSQTERDRRKLQNGIQLNKSNKSTYADQTLLINVGLISMEEIEGLKYRLSVRGGSNVLYR